MTLRPVEPEIQQILKAINLAVARITFIKADKVIFTIDQTHEGVRLIYSRGFLDLLKRIN